MGIPAPAEITKVPDAAMSIEQKLARYTIRNDRLGWSVIDTVTGNVACREGVTLTGLTLVEADDLADAMSWLARRRDKKRGQKSR